MKENNNFKEQIRALIIILHCTLHNPLALGLFVNEISMAASYLKLLTFTYTNRSERIHIDIHYSAG